MAWWRATVVVAAGPGLLWWRMDLGARLDRRVHDGDEAARVARAEIDRGRNAAHGMFPGW